MSGQMPLITIPRLVGRGLTADEQALVDYLAARLARKNARNLLRTAYYDGKHAVTQVGGVVPPQYYQLGIVLGWSAKAVDLLADRCNLEQFVWPGGELDSLGSSELYAANEMGSEVAQAVVSALLHGVVFAISTKGGAGEPAGLLHFKDATEATGIWNR